MKELIFSKQVQSNPSELDILRILKYRNQELFLPHERLYYSLSAGKMGELEVINFFKEYGRAHWKFVSNYWGDLSGSFESDLTIFAGNQCRVLEIKNYTGVFEYKDGISRKDGEDFNTNCVFQARRAFKNIRSIIQDDIGFDNVKGALIFIGENNEVNFHSPVDDIQIVRRHQLMRFIQQLAHEEDRSITKAIDFQAVTEKLNAHHIENPFKSDPLTFEEMQSVQPGIVCANCASFDVKISRKFVTCKCNHRELLHDAILRTIHEYATLRYDQVIRRKDLFRFFNGEVSTRTLTKVLGTYFERVGAGRGAHYLNVR